MIFMSQSGLLDSSKEAEWGLWYVEHLRIMRTVDGIHSAQRFTTSDRGHPPSLAMYTIESPDVFDDPYYQKIRGMGEWLPLIDRQYYRRNLFDGLRTAPEITEASELWVADRDTPDLVLDNTNLNWLQAVGIDQSTPWRGIAVVPQGTDPSAAKKAGVAVYQLYA